MRQRIEKFFNRILSFVERIVLALESPEIPLQNYLLTFFAIITVRNVRDFYYTQVVFASQLTAALHLTVSYVSFMLTLLLWFYGVTRESIEKIFRVILPFFLVIWFAPIVDFIVNLWLKHIPVAAYVVIPPNQWLRYFTFLWEAGLVGVTPGMRVEVVFVFWVSLFYFYLKTRKIGKSLSGALGGCFVIALYIANPFLNFLSRSQSPDSQFFQFYLFLIFLTGAILAYCSQKSYFVAIIKDLRLTRVLHFELLFLAGFLYQRSQPSFCVGDMFNVFFMMVAILFACLHALMSNNCVDIKIDRVSNKERPLVSGTIPQKTYQRMAQVFLILALIYASAVSVIAFLCIASFIGNYYLYSMPPLRLKRLPVLSKSLIAMNSFLLFLAGFSWEGPRLPDISSLTLLIAFSLFTLVLNFIDIKDYEGDKVAGIKTLPTLLGLEKSKMLIGLFFVVTYLYAAFLLGQEHRWFFFFVLGVIQLLLINRKDYQEQPVFCVYLASVIYIMLRSFLG